MVVERPGAPRTVRPTLASLAAELGVSRTTVSNAYNKPEELAPATRTRILAAAQRRGYYGPDAAARSLRMRHTGAIGVLLTEDLTYAFDDRPSVDFLSGIASSCSGAHTALTLLPVGPEDTSGGGTLYERSVGASSDLVARAVVDGFVVYSVSEKDMHLHATQARGLPYLIVDQPKTSREIPFVGIDDVHAIAPTTEALLAAGHRRIGILCIRLSRERCDGVVTEERLHHATMHVQRDRVLGALQVCASAGIDPRSVPIVERYINDHANNVDAARELLTRFPDITAVLCTVDAMALGVLEYAREQGIDVPNELSVTGFDGTDMALMHHITTIIQPNKRKGLLAGTVLRRLTEGIDPGNMRTLLKTEFYPGATVKPPEKK